MASTTGTEEDREALIAIVKEMSESMTGAQSTKHWAKDALWFDTPPFASRGLPPAIAMFDKVFSSFRSYHVDLLETDVFLKGDMGIVCTIQRVSIEFKTGDKKSLVLRETDCFEKRSNKWQLIHQHASTPAGGEWDGQIITAS